MPLHSFVYLVAGALITSSPVLASADHHNRAFEKDGKLTWESAFGTDPVIRECGDGEAMIISDISGTGQSEGHKLSVVFCQTSAFENAQKPDLLDSALSDLTYEGARAISNRYQLANAIGLLEQAARAAHTRFCRSASAG